MQVWQAIGYVVLGGIGAFAFYVTIVLILRLVGCKPLTAKWITVGVLVAYFTSACCLYLLILSGNEQIIHLNVTDGFSIGIAMYWAMLLSLNFAVMPFLYWLDKRKSFKKGGTRIPESVLHFFAYVGGGVGAYASQRFFRHKTVKQSFRKMFWITFMCSVLIYSMSIYLLLYGTSDFKSIHVYINKVIHYMS